VSATATGNAHDLILPSLGIGILETVFPPEVSMGHQESFRRER
jgi:hypothetical protein